MNTPKSSELIGAFYKDAEQILLQSGKTFTMQDIHLVVQLIMQQANSI